MAGATFDSVDAYIASFPGPTRVALDAVRSAVRRGVPHGEESISYDMPTMNVDGRYVVYFAAWKHHLSLHGVPELPPDLEREIAPLRSGRGTVKLPLRDPMPIDLIERVARHLADRHCR